MDQGKLTITDSRTGQDYEIPIADSSVSAIQLRQIRQDPAEFGMLSYDPGYTNTASCTSRITYIDGGRGILRYRGYPIEELADRCTYTEVAYLLRHGNLPTRSELEDWDSEVRLHSQVDEQVKRFISSFGPGAHPMAVLISTVAAMSTCYPEARHVGNPDNRRLQHLRLLGQLPTVAAHVFRNSQGLPPVEADSSLRYAELFVHMLWKGTSQQRTPREAQVLAKALDRLFILHADHEQNCSTSTMRQVASADSDPYVSVAAAASALFGPLHGGANEAVLRMLEEIRSVDRIPGFMMQVKSGKRRLMGFGHRVYKNYDPRARIIREIASEVFEVTGRNPKIDLAMKLEQIALQDAYFVKRQLYPNVDFYSGIIYQAMGFQPEMFTVLFALGRVAGWLAHWEEFMSDPEKRIARPRQIYLGRNKTCFVAMKDREEG